MAVSYEDLGARLGDAMPCAVTLARAARLYEVDPARVAAAAARLEPLAAHADGSPRWSLSKLGEQLGLARRRSRSGRQAKGTIARPSLPARSHRPGNGAVHYSRAHNNDGRGMVEVDPELAGVAGELEDLADLAAGER